MESKWQEERQELVSKSNKTIGKFKDQAAAQKEMAMSLLVDKVCISH